MMNGDLPKPTLIPNGMPNTVVPCGTERNLANWTLNGHVPVLADSPCTGYIIAVHRKMVSVFCLVHIVHVTHFESQQGFFLMSI